MRSVFLSIIFLVLMSFSFAQNIAITDDDSYEADPTAILDIKSTNMGMLIPRVDYNNLPAVPATGLLVYITANGPLGNNAFYYYNGSSWKKILTKNDETDPVFAASAASGITTTDTANWNNKLDSYIETQNLDAVLTLNNSAGNKNITNLTDPVNAQDAATKAYVTLAVSTTGDTLYLGSEQWVIIPGISVANHGGGSSIVDGRGNVYTYVTIGTQDWLAENLKTSKYNDGTSIPLVIDDYTWYHLTTPGYCWYGHDQDTYGDIYGAYYNWYAVNTGKLCPIGWHVPTDVEWTTLTTFLEGESVAGGKLKEPETTHWSDPNTGATNETGFTALPAGSRDDSGGFIDLSYRAIFWSSTEYTIYKSFDRWIINNSSNVFKDNHSKIFGLSVRCVRD